MTTHRTAPYRRIIHDRTVPYRTVPYRTIPYRTVPYPLYAPLLRAAVPSHVPTRTSLADVPIHHGFFHPNRALLLNLIKLYAYFINNVSIQILVTSI